MRDFGFKPVEKETVWGVTLVNARKLFIERADFTFLQGEPSPSSLFNFRDALAILHGLSGDNPVIPTEVMEKIEQVYPNYRFVNEFVESHLLEAGDETDIGNNNAVESIHPENGYAVVSKEIINLLYKEKQAEIQSLRNRANSNSPVQMAVSFVSNKIDEKSEEKTPKTIEDLERELKELEATGLISEENLRNTDSAIDVPQ